MEIYRHILCISGTELIRTAENPGGVVSEGYYKKLRHLGRIRVLRRGCYGTPALVEYESLPESLRREWEKLHGDPRRQAALEPFRARIRPDIAALEFFSAYRYGGGKALPPEKIEQYAADAAVLNAVGALVREAEAEARRLHRRPDALWERALAAVDSVREQTGCALPRAVRTLRRRYERYAAGGYRTLVHAGYGNGNSAKLSDDLSRALMTELLAHGNQPSAPAVAEAYNLWAAANGRPTVTSRTVSNFLRDHDYEIAAPRNGSRAWADRYDQVVRRYRPSAPLLLVNSDDNDLDLYFKSVRLTATPAG